MLKFFPSKIKELNYGSEKLFLIEGYDYALPKNVEYFEPNFKPQIDHDFKNCSSCKSHYLNTISFLENKHSQFPNCCEHHKNLKKLSFFKKEDFKDEPKNVTDKIFYTYQHILNYIDRDNWEIEIKDYIDYIHKSFATFPLDCGGVLYYYHFQTNLFSLLDYKLKKYQNERLLVVKNYIENWFVNESSVDFFSNEEKRIQFINEWLSSPLFKLPYFAKFKEKFSKPQFFIVGKPKYNRYSNQYKAKLANEKEFKEFFLNLTSKFLEHLDTTKLINEEFLNKNTEIQFNLDKTRHIAKQKKIFDSDNSEFYKKLNKWVANEKKYIKKVLKNIDSSTNKTSNPNKVAKPLNKKPIDNNTTKPTFENSISTENQKFILQLMEDLSITIKGKSVLSPRSKSIIRGMVEALRDSGYLPSLSIHDLCVIIADKIDLKLNAKLENTYKAQDTYKQVKNYIKSNK